VASNLLEGLTFKVADDEERLRALELRTRIYTQELGTTGQDRFDTLAFHLIAKDSTGSVVACLRIVGPEDRPFDIERLVDISPFVQTGKSPAEISRFCVEPSHRDIAPGHTIHLGMLKLVYEFTLRYHITDLFTLVMPHLITFYRFILFKPLHVNCEHPIFGSAHLMHLDLDGVRRRLQHASTPVAQLLFHTDLPNVVV